MSSSLTYTRYIDTLVAKHVFGLDVVSDNWPCGYDPECGAYEAMHVIAELSPWLNDRGPVYKPEQGGVWPAEHLSGSDYVYVYPVPFYSTDIVDAFTVFLWLAEHGITRLSNGDGDSFDVDFIPTGFNSPLRTAHISEESYELAICRAALSAMGIKMEWE